MSKSLEIIAAFSFRNRGIGNVGKIPWSLPEDLARFSSITKETLQPNKCNAVIMGRKTWESLPKKFRPLPKRLNVVLSSSEAFRSSIVQEYRNDQVCVFSEFQHALEHLNALDSVEKIFAIGGSRIYNLAIQHESCHVLHLTEIFQDFDCDAFFPDIDFRQFERIESSDVKVEQKIAYQFTTYKKKHDVNVEEFQYLDLIRDILSNGVYGGDRTGTGTYSLFGRQLRFNLRNDRFPLLTTKKVFWRGVAEELLWFIGGNTNAKILQDKNIRIWDGNSSKEFLDRIGLSHREEGDLGPVYGFQWRHFGAEYTNMHADYSNQGVDQLQNCIDLIKKDPNNRRIVMSAWNPADLDKMALPPCHMFCQFYVANGELSCMMYQRSCDVGLGVPFNIASYALLTRIIAQVTGLKAGDFVHVLGDAHIYSNHVEALEEQLKRDPRNFPVLKINPVKTDIDSFVFEDFEIVGYSPHKTIKMQMAV